MKITLIIIFTIFVNSCNVQDNKITQDEFNFLVEEVEGDINRDGLNDKVIIKQDTVNTNAPYKVEVYIADANGNHKLITSSTKLIEPEFPNGKNGYITGTNFSNIEITSGIIKISSELTRGYFEHKFRFKNGNLELVEYFYTSSDGLGETTTIAFDLLSGERIIKTINYQTDEVLRRTKENKKIEPLPKFEDITPFETEFY